MLNGEALLNRDDAKAALTTKGGIARPLPIGMAVGA
jgi:hypothetical protein